MVPPLRGERAVELEVAYAADCLRLGILGLNAGLFRDYVQHIADRRLERIGLEARYGSPNPFPWRSEVADLEKEKKLLRDACDRVPVRGGTLVGMRGSATEPLTESIHRKRNRRQPCRW